jgi:8-oxo-dGTP pyrophosphatase MutT (NUDIX family)
MMSGENDFICNDLLLQQIRSNLRGFKVMSSEREGLKKAAVAIAVVDVFHGPDMHGLSKPHLWDKGAALILTRRTSRLKHHSGQWALPGGRQEKGESAEDTALRELQEEVGLKLKRDSVIGRLDDFITRSGFIITPLVIWGGPGVDLTPNPAEVKSLHRISISEFLREDAPILQHIPESENPVLLMPVGVTWIASPTAALIYQFREVAILGRDTRVAHYEQPYFAWA